MTPIFNVDLTINMPDGGRHARHLLNMYSTEMPADILAAAYKLCDTDETVQARKFSKLILKRMEVWSSQEHSLKIFVLLSVSGEDSRFIDQAIAKYMEGFPEDLKRARSMYLPSADLLPDNLLQPTDWNAEVHQA